MRITGGMTNFYLFFEAGVGDDVPFLVNTASVNGVRMAPLSTVAPALDFTLTEPPPFAILAPLSALRRKKDSNLSI